MFRSLVANIVILGVLVILALLALAVLLLTSSRQVADSFAWVAHTQQVLHTASEPVDLVRRVESELRGAAISGDRASPREWRQLLNRARLDLDRLVILTADNPAQNRQARSLQTALSNRSSFLLVSLSRTGDISQIDARVAFSTDRLREARQLMAEVDAARDTLVAAEQRLLFERTRDATQRLASNRRLLVIGVPAVAVLLAFVLIIIIQAIRTPTRTIVTAMQLMGSTNRAVPLDESRMKSLEFAAIAEGYNAMIERLEEAMEAQHAVEETLQSLNLELQDRSHALETRNQVIERLGLMARRMQAARTDDELAEVISRFLPQFLPGMPGAVYAHNNSRNLLVQIASWGGPLVTTDRFSPDECWALRLGQSHGLLATEQDVICKHVDSGMPYHCEPLLAGGEVIGLLHVGCTIEPDMQFRLRAVAEDISSALVNHRLQRNLREQTVRDPLTGLFNRRYLEESLKTELARAMRSNASLTVVMCDIDHFKRFNDEFGHDAGDYVLKAVAAAMQSHFRGGDLVCRFGGEEFTVIAPGATAEVMVDRIERLRIAITNLQLRFAGQSLGNVSASFGLANFLPGMANDGSSLLQAADEALYSAKRQGRNCAIIAHQQSEEAQDTPL